jgi:NADH-quinone oxidoreductase subunit N
VIDVVFGVAEWKAVAPFGIVALGGMFVLLYEVFASPRPSSTRVMWIAQLGLLAGLVATLRLWGSNEAAFGGTFALDGIALFANLIFLFAASLCLLMAEGYLEMIQVRAREFYPLVLFATSGMMVMAAARDLILLFLGLEIMSVASYVLAGIHRRDPASGEASLKYFVLGAFATCFLLYGIALLYGVTGQTSYTGIAAGLEGAPELAVFGGLALLIVGLGFKVAAVPFHFWTPDVYQGAPSAVTALMAVGVKAAAFTGFARLFLTGLVSVHVDWAMLLWWLAVLTMTTANAMAIVQRNVKRMLAYSSIAHAGYLLVPIVAGTPRGGAAMLFYLLAYAFMTLGAFGVVIALGAKGEPNEMIEDYQGLGDRRPLLAGAMVLFLLSLTGIPPLVGFVGKLYLIEAAVNAGYIWLAAIVVLNSAVAAYYYLSVVIAMFMRDPVKPVPAWERRPYLSLSLFVATVGTIFLGVFPSFALDFARVSFHSIVR